MGKSTIANLLLNVDLIAEFDEYGEIRVQQKNGPLDPYIGTDKYKS